MKQKKILSKRILSSMFVLGISFLLILLTSCSTQVYQDTTTTIEKGRVVLTVTDAMVDMNTITNIKMTIDKVEFHSDADGWVTVATPQRTYDLIALDASGDNSLLADLSLIPERYDQIRLEVSDIFVTDITGTYEGKMPSTTLRFNAEIIVLSNKTSTVSFDFIADQSLFKTIDDQYVFAPLIQLESRTDANADTSVSNNVILLGGEVQTSSRVGMDVLGNLVVGGTIPPFVQINADGTISGTENELNTNTG